VARFLAQPAQLPRVRKIDGRPSGLPVVQKLLPRNSWLQRRRHGQDSAIQILVVDIELVTSSASAPQLCRIHGFEQLRACQAPKAVVALDDATLGSPGVGMLDAAEEIRERVYAP
jgi:hypothetical protein